MQVSEVSAFTTGKPVRAPDRGHVRMIEHGSIIENVRKSTVYVRSWKSAVTIRGYERLHRSGQADANAAATTEHARGQLFEQVRASLTFIPSPYRAKLTIDPVKVLLDGHVEADGLLERAEELDGDHGTDTAAINRQHSKACSHRLNTYSKLAWQFADRTVIKHMKMRVCIEVMTQLFAAILADHMAAWELVLGRFLHACEARLLTVSAGRQEMLFDQGYSPTSKHQHRGISLAGASKCLVLCCSRTDASVMGCEYFLGAEVLRKLADGD
ncbi:hypothetical protein PMIN01_13320 [Paraphaeosphaeria minitans]|uniref:Uncharacterized protein n=1 Tax=Paraphaeosphaeria minitans TaxID=565426 RepID=A0A9P6G3N8_9PLEO|nr:hypothetical protein PMIN01_13320 [Paraphaeosphaeria minitans]